ncbi:hypothetical protein JOB18_008649 [Solea senegalensis]|nr:hypothetical protein JOB18_008649 [Solea senegalensis]
MPSSKKKNTQETRLLLTFFPAINTDEKARVDPRGDPTVRESAHTRGWDEKVRLHTKSFQIGE